jgi:hypothetical protein
MRSIEVAFGLPEAELLPALQVVTENFDESPASMHAVLGPATGSIRWFTIACTTIGRNQVLAQDHFIESIDRDSLIVVTRLYDGEPLLAERGRLQLSRDGETITVRGEALPDGARRDGAVDEILLGALDLAGVPRPFEALAAPTHEVVLRRDHEQPDALAIVPFAGAVLPTRIEPRSRARGDIVETFAHAARVVETDPAALASHASKLLDAAESQYSQFYERDFAEYVAELVRVGPAIAPVLVEYIARADRQTKAVKVAAVALRRLDGPGASPAAAVREAADRMIAWAAKPSEMPQLVGYAALLALGGAARPALEAARASKRARERIVGGAVLAMLDEPAWQPLLVAGDDPLDGLDYWQAAAKMDACTIDDWFAFMAAFVRRPREWWARYPPLKQAVEHAGGMLAPIADQLLRYPPFEDDAMLSAVARDQPIPDPHELRAAGAKTGKLEMRGPASTPKSNAKRASKPKRAKG